MKFAWLVEGPLVQSSAYSQQIYLFSNYLYNFGVESVIANPMSFKDQGDETMQQIIAYDPDIIVAFGDTHPWEMAEHIGIPMISWFLWGTSKELPFEESFPLVTFATVSPDVQQRFADKGIEAAYVPHAFDPSVFHVGRRKSARARLGWTEDRPTVLMVSTNLATSDHELGPDRKNWAGGLDAFALALEERPDAVLYCHTTAVGALSIPDYCRKLGIEDSVFLADQDRLTQVHRGFDANYVADLYRASDLLLFPSLGEGFGIPLIEAQACGIPVVTTGAPPMSELCRRGRAVRARPNAERPDWAQPDEKKLAEAIVKWLSVPPAPLLTSSAVRDYAIEAVIEDHFLPLLEAVAPQKRVTKRVAVESGPLKIDIGSGGLEYSRHDDTWTTVDRFAQAQVAADMWDLPWQGDSVDEVWSGHALEHIPRERVIPTLSEWYRVLKPGGKMTVIVPDFNFAAQKWLEEPVAETLAWVWGSQVHDGEFHKTGWSLEMLKKDVESVGFIVDTAQIQWTPEYSQDSIIVEAMKP